MHFTVGARTHTNHPAASHHKYTHTLHPTTATAILAPSDGQALTPPPLPLSSLTPLWKREMSCASVRTDVTLTYVGGDNLIYAFRLSGSAQPSLTATVVCCSIGRETTRNVKIRRLKMCTSFVQGQSNIFNILYVGSHAEVPTTL